VRSCDNDLKSTHFYCFIFCRTASSFATAILPLLAFHYLTCHTSLWDEWRQVWQNKWQVVPNPVSLVTCRSFTSQLVTCHIPRFVQHPWQWETRKQNTRLNYLITDKTNQTKFKFWEQLHNEDINAYELGLTCACEFPQICQFASFTQCVSWLNTEVTYQMAIKWNTTS